MLERRKMKQKKVEIIGNPQIRSSLTTEKSSNLSTSRQGSCSIHDEMSQEAEDEPSDQPTTAKTLQTELTCTATIENDYINTLGGETPKSAIPNLYHLKSSVSHGHFFPPSTKTPNLTASFSNQTGTNSGSNPVSGGVVVPGSAHQEEVFNFIDTSVEVHDQSQGKVAKKENAHSVATVEPLKSIDYIEIAPAVKDDFVPDFNPHVLKSKTEILSGSSAAATSSKNSLSDKLPPKSARSLYPNYKLNSPSIFKNSAFFNTLSKKLPTPKRSEKRKSLPVSAIN